MSAAYGSCCFRRPSMACIVLLLLVAAAAVGRLDGRAVEAPSPLENELLVRDMLSSLRKQQQDPLLAAADQETNSTTGLFDSFSLDHHHSNFEVNQVLKAIHAKCPTHTRLYELSQRSVNGWPLTVIRFGAATNGSGSGHGLLTPEARLVANIHGNEVLGRELLLKLAHFLCQQLSVPHPDPGSEAMDAQHLVNWTGIHLLVSMNPDGWDIATRSLAEGVNGDSGSNSDALVTGSDGIVGRANANGVDLNRDFPDMSADRSITSSSASSIADHEMQPETKAVVEWITSSGSSPSAFVLSAALHGGSLVANYPYDHTPVHSSVDASPADATPLPNASSGGSWRRSYAPTPDDDTFRSLALTYARNHESMWASHGCDAADADFSRNDGITNGAAWYPVLGGMQDFSYLATNAFELTIETGCDKYPAAETLEREWKANKNSLIEFLWRAHSGIKGLILAQDATTPLAAKISVKNVTSGRDQIIDHDVFSSASGEYWRLLTPGVYEVTADAGPDYDSVTKLVSVPHQVGRSPATRIDFFLKPRPRPREREEEQDGNQLDPLHDQAQGLLSARKRSDPSLAAFLSATRTGILVPEQESLLRLMGEAGAYADDAAERPQAVDEDRENGFASSAVMRGAGIENDDDDDDRVNEVEDMRLMMESQPSAGLSYDFSNPELLEYGKYLMGKPQVGYRRRQQQQEQQGERVQDGAGAGRLQQQQQDKRSPQVSFM